MENELLFNPSQIIVTQGLVKFTQYEKIKEQAVQLAKQIKTVEVNDENIKESKKLLAAVNKRCKELEDERIRIKKLMLEPYQEFEDQVKEIVGIVKEADNEVRQQVKQLEEFERSKKQIELEELFQKRKKQYPLLEELILFHNFLEQRHLNKTTTIESVEKEMVEWFEKTKKDVEVIAAMNHSTDVLNVYLFNFDLAEAIQQVNKDQERRKAIEKSQAFKNVAVEKRFLFEVFEEKDCKLVEMFMTQNNIEFEMKVI